MSDAQPDQPKPISDDLLQILVCPVSKKPVDLSEDGSKLVCRERCEDPKCPREYPIENGIPRMVVSD